MNTKQKGNIGVGIAIAYYTSIGAVVSVPINDSQDYDLLVDIDSFIYTVQVKYTSEKTSSGYYTVGLRSISGSSKQEYKNVGATNVDFLFITTKDYQIFLIPVAEITQISAITLNTSFKEKYGIVGEWSKPVSC